MSVQGELHHFRGKFSTPKGNYTTPMGNMSVQGELNNWNLPINNGGNMYSTSGVKLYHFRGNHLFPGENYTTEIYRGLITIPFMRGLGQAMVILELYSLALYFLMIETGLKIEIIVRCANNWF